MADTRVQLIMSVVDRALGPLKSIAGGAGGLAGKAKAASDAVKGLSNQIKSIDRFAKVSNDLKTTSAALQAARERTKALGLEMRGTAQPTKEMSAAFNAARNEAARLKDRQAKLTEQQQRLRGALQAAGVPIKGMAEHQANLRTQVAAATAELDKQRGKLTALAQLREKHGRQMAHTAMIGGAGMAGMAAGRKMAQPVLSSVDAYRQQEDASSQLRASMMQAGGGVLKEFREISELAQRLGDKLPGTTADFYEMMTMLRRQGMSAQVILGGLGEAAAYLGVQLRMPVTEAAEFAAKMQDATRTPERDMMALMDGIQRAYYLGVDKDNMLAGFTKLSPAMSILRKEGLAAVNEMAPLLVMMDQMGMRGEASGNAIRKVLQGAMDTGKVGKANKASGLKLDFTDGKGEFGGLDKMFEQLQQLKGLNTVKRLSALKTIFGDDAETLQVLSALIDKGRAGYDEVMGKMKAQAALRERVDSQLKTITNLWEAASGTFTNVLASIGETVQGDVKALITWLSGITEKVSAWTKANPELTRALALTVAVIAAVTFGLSALALAFASTFGPMLLARFLFARMAVSLFGARAAAWGILPALRAIAVMGGGLLKGGLLNLISIFKSLATVMGIIGRVVVMAFFNVGRAALMFLFTPFGAALALLAGAAYLVYSRWAEIKAGFFLLMSDIGAGIMAGVQAVKSFALQFVQAGGALIDGLIQGITGKLGALKSTIVEAAKGAATWFKEKLGIHSPSRVFMALGQNIPEGAALGIQRGSSLMRGAALAMATVPLTATAGTLGGAPLAMATVPLTATAGTLGGAPLMAAGAGGAAAGGPGTTITITINAAPGQDPQAIARAVAAELDRRAAADRRRVRSQNADID